MVAINEADVQIDPKTDQFNNMYKHNFKLKYLDFH